MQTHHEVQQHTEHTALHLPRRPITIGPVCDTHCTPCYSDTACYKVWHYTGLLNFTSSLYYQQQATLSTKRITPRHTTSGQAGGCVSRHHTASRPNSLHSSSLSHPATGHSSTGVSLLSKRNSNARPHTQDTMCKSLSWQSPQQQKKRIGANTRAEAVSTHHTKPSYSTCSTRSGILLMRLG